jgi:hypothetical protein
VDLLIRGKLRDVRSFEAGKLGVLRAGAGCRTGDTHQITFQRYYPLGRQQVGVLWRPDASVSDACSCL